MDSDNGNRNHEEDTLNQSTDMKRRMKKARIILTAIALLSITITTNAKKETKSESERIRDIIERVNDTWQKEHNAETRAFWDEAAYHTGNMEAYRLTGKEKYRKYSERWAEHNDWKGAKGENRREWTYATYGEDENHVMFGDWQVCFQTYADLYNILPDDKRIKRAREVMEYQMSTDARDYWWWADGLYMVMPVMTKLHKITGNGKYLDKLAEYLAWADSIMWDEEAGLYYRDAKYVYPQHKTEAGKKDFWARGDGWVMAGFAKVLQDVSPDWKHRKEIERKLNRMAEAVAEAQQEEGYWTRSILDAEQAPGRETSGTAFMAYALQWGINNGVLDAEKYQATADKAWKYLETTALRPDRRIGYVQPIGEKAIPGQVVDATSTSNFGTGAFLLAACERVRYLEGNEQKGNGERAYWVETARKIAEPVLSLMSEGRLQEEMMVEVSPTWDGRNKKVTYMETFGRLMAGIAPWLSLPDDDTEEGQIRKKLREQALKSYRNAVDPESGDCLLWQGEGQIMVDAAYIAESFLRGWDALWMPLDDATKERYIRAFEGIRDIDPPYTNWLLFSSTIEAFLSKAGAKADVYRVNSAVRKMEEWYTGDGWYADGPDFAFDYYSSYVFHPMYLETLATMNETTPWTRISYGDYYRRAFRRAQRYAIILERFISPEGTFPVFGRSIPYRMATMQPLALMALYKQLPSGLSEAQVRSALTAVMHRMYDDTEIFNEGGFLTIGFTGPQKCIADWYTNNGSLYMTSLSLLPLGLPATDPFWTDASQPWTSVKAWSGKDFPKDHRWEETEKFRDRY